MAQGNPPVPAPIFVLIFVSIFVVPIFVLIFFLIFVGFRESPASDEDRDKDQDEKIAMAKSKAQLALEFVLEEAKRSASETDLHNAFFGNGGKYGQLFPTRAEREAFAKTPEYEEIVRIRASLGRKRKRSPA
jgi:hypothetical protein